MFRLVSSICGIQVVEGAADGSTTFWFDPRMAGFSVMDSSNVTVRNVAIEYTKQITTSSKFSIVR